MKLIIGLVGEKFAGKDAVALYFADKYGAAHIRFSHILDDILRILNLPISRRNEIDLGLGLRKIFGSEVLGQAIIKLAKEATAEIVVINGIRMDEMENIKNIGAKIIYITAPPEIRFERYLIRREKADDGTMNFEQFKEHEKELTEIGIPELGKRADFRIDNIGTLEELYEKANKIIQNLKIKI